MHRQGKNNSGKKKIRGEDGWQDEEGLGTKFSQLWWWTDQKGNWKTVEITSVFIFSPSFYL